MKGRVACVQVYIPQVEGGRGLEERERERKRDVPTAETRRVNSRSVNEPSRARFRRVPISKS